VEFDTTITSRVDSLGLGGSEDDRGFGGFSIRLVDPEHLAFASGGKTITPNGAAVDAGRTWALPGAGGGSPAWSVGLACKANGQAVTRWMLYNDRSMQNCVFPGRAPLVLKKDEALHLQETLVIRPVPKKKPPGPFRKLSDAMADIVNLNQARKAKAKADDKARAAENRAKFGRTKGEKTLDSRPRRQAQARPRRRQARGLSPDGWVEETLGEPGRPRDLAGPGAGVLGGAGPRGG
jgi:hypothetical protein